MAEEQLILSETKIHKFAGEFPEVPTYANVDTALLYQGDDTPFHVTLEIARVGETSGNYMVYDEDVVSEIEAQLPGLGGIRGHLPKDKRSTEFPIEAIDWIGHTRVGGSLWAKAYVPPGQNREELRRRRARGGGLATSIYGPYDSIVKLDGKRWKPRGLTLETVDLAPVPRAALKLGGSFAITAEMKDDTEEIPMTEDQGQVISELSKENTKLVSELEALQIDHKAVIAELTNMFGDDWKTEAKRVVDELAKAQVDNGKRAVKDVITELVGDKEELEDLRLLVAEKLGEDFSDAVKAREIITEYMATDFYKRQAQRLMAELAGPRVVVAPRTSDGQLPKIDDEFVAAASRWAGF